LLNKLIEKWNKIWLEKKFIEDIWNRIHKESLKIQEK
jgi:chorismate mutase